MRPLSTLRSDMSLGATDTVLHWIKTKAEHNWYNIVLVDFVDYEKFTTQIIALNRAKRPPSLASLPALFSNLQLVGNGNLTGKMLQDSQKSQKKVKDDDSEQQGRHRDIL